MSEPIVQALGVKKYYKITKGKYRNQLVKAVDQVNLTIHEGETLGLVGESGCGKSTLGRVILHLIEATDGEIRLFGQDIRKLSPKDLKEMRKSAQMIFQNPYASLNPRMTVMDSVRAPLDVHRIGTREERRERVLEMLDRVGLDESYASRYPHEFSGGQRQRIFIARALILNPRFVVCDEPVSSLDVSVRAQVLNLLQEIQARSGVSYLFISHDLSVVKHISDRIAVMYLGRIVEIASKEELYEKPLHPYTKALMSAIPIPAVDQQKKRIMLEGDVPNPIELPDGCCFHTRCPYATERCKRKIPALRSAGGSRQVACWLYQESEEGG